MPAPLPPQTLAESDGMEGLVVWLPRAVPRARLTRRAAEVLVAMLVVAGSIGAGLVFGVLGMLLALLMLLVPGALLVGRVFERQELLEMAVRFDARSLTVDGQRHLWGDLVSVRFRETDDPELTELVLARHDGVERVFAIDRRSSIVDPVGVTRKQRAWIEREAAAAIERAGSQRAVPETLDQLR